MASKPERKPRVVADNRKARFNYFIDETMEAGLALTGTEVKSLRQGKATIGESYADARNGEIWLVNANIPEYQQAGRFNHAPKRPRKLLLHKRQIHRLAAAVEQLHLPGQGHLCPSGTAAVPLDGCRLRSDDPSAPD